jgi:hypothetical protein
MVAFMGAFLGVLTPLLVVGALRRKNPALLGPLLPLSFVFAYQWDLAYGTKMVRIRKEAEKILASEQHLLDLPGGAPTVHEIDRAIALQLEAEDHDSADKRA